VVGKHDDEHEESQVVLKYLRETRIGCEKDPSFAKGRNLITHAVDLIGSKSRDDCVSGVQMMYAAICRGERRLMAARLAFAICTGSWQDIIMQNMMLKYLITPASSSPLLQKLLQTLDPRGIFDRETRNRGATRVENGKETFRPFSKKKETKSKKKGNGSGIMRKRNGNGIF
jgi:hypothetical protein